MGVSSHSGHEDEVITLSCNGTVEPQKMTAQLASHITVTWIGPSGVDLTEENGITLGTPQQSVHGVVHTLTINGTKYSHSGVYSCVVKLNTSHDSTPEESVAKHHLMIKSL